MLINRAKNEIYLKRKTEKLCDKTLCYSTLVEFERSNACQKSILWKKFNNKISNSKKKRKRRWKTKEKFINNKLFNHRYICERSEWNEKILESKATTKNKIMKKDEEKLSKAKQRKLNDTHYINKTQEIKLN